MAADTDHNDLAKKKGLHAVKTGVEKAVKDSICQRFGLFELRAGGVFLHKGEDADPLFFSSFLKPVGLARSLDGQEYSLLMEMRNPDGRMVAFLLRPEDLHAGSGERARIEFAKRGGYFGQGIRPRTLFADYINAIMGRSKSLPRLVLVERTGWADIDGAWVFVLPGGSIGPKADRVVLAQSLAGESQ